MAALAVDSDGGAAKLEDKKNVGVKRKPDGDDNDDDKHCPDLFATNNQQILCDPYNFYHTIKYMNRWLRRYYQEERDVKGKEPVCECGASPRMTWLSSLSVERKDKPLFTPDQFLTLTWSGRDGVGSKTLCIICLCYIHEGFGIGLPAPANHQAVIKTRSYTHGETKAKLRDITQHTCHGCKKTNTIAAIRCLVCQCRSHPACMVGWELVWKEKTFGGRCAECRDREPPKSYPKDSLLEIRSLKPLNKKPSSNSNIDALQAKRLKLA